MKKRIFGLDLTRSIAFLFVIIVHSFLNSNFNNTDLKGFQMFFLLMVRCLSFTGVLLFIILTGYCKSNKDISKKHYSSIVKILIVYLVISIITILFKKYYLNDDTILYDYIIGIFNFTTIPYAWYLEMYIGLFLLIPFLNILYNNLKTKRNKQILIITLLFISSISTTFSNLNIETRSLDLLPNWWNLYPILLYYIGAYIKEYQININKYINLLFILVVIFLQAFVMFSYCGGNALYVEKIFVYESNFPSIILAVLVFLLLYNIRTHSKVLSKIVYYISYASLGGYLISFCCDKLIYKLANLNINSSNYFIICTFVLTPIIFIISTIISIIINKIIDGVSKITKKIHNNYKLKVMNKELY